METAPKKRGRPPGLVPGAKRRVVPLKIHITSDERARYIEAAKQAGKSISQIGSELFAEWAK